MIALRSRDPEAMLVDDFYTGFEGHPEISIDLVQNGSVWRRVRIWVGRFDALMARINPEPSGWTGLALRYHLHDGWCEVSPWTLPAALLGEVRAQWAAISTRGCSDDELAVHQAVLRLLQEAERTAATVQFTYS